MSWTWSDRPRRPWWERGNAPDDRPRRTDHDEGSRSGEPTEAPRWSGTLRGIPPGVPAASRRPCGRSRPGQRSRDRCSPSPTIPVLPPIVLTVLQRRWIARGLGQPTLWRTRSLAALAVALAVPVGTTSIALCSMLPAEVLRLRLPRPGWRWVRRWLRIRSDWLPTNANASMPWLALPPLSRGRPRMIGWGMCQTLNCAGVPAWRVKDLLRARWLPHCAAVPFRDDHRP